MINKIFIKILNKLFKNYFDKKLLMLGTSHILNMRKNYKNISNLNEVDFKVFSQNGEDGIIDYLLFSLQIEKPKFIEIGVGDYYESNTRFLFERSSGDGLIIDIIDNFQKRVEKNIRLWKGNLKILNRKIDSGNILSTLKEFNFFDNIDLFSIDVDGIDYWILEKMPKKFCKLIVAEYNPYFGSNLEISVPNDKNFDRSKYHHSNLCFGASLKSIINLLDRKGFVFLGTNLFKNNAFFVNSDFKDNLFLEIPNNNELNSFTNASFRESRDINNKLNFIDPKDILNEIKKCKVVDLSSSENKVKKIEDLLN